MAIPVTVTEGKWLDHITTNVVPGGKHIEGGLLSL